MKPQYKIQVENSAPSQTRVARSVVWASEILSTIGVTRVADLGCGRLRNYPVLQKYFPNITLVDTELQCKRIADLVPKRPGVILLHAGEFEARQRKYEAIFLISVLHVIDKPNYRRQLLNVAHISLTTKGYLVTDVPTGEAYYRKKCTPGNVHGDGWCIGSGSIRTFYKNYSASDFDRLITSSNRFTLYKKVWNDHHLVRIWQRTE